MDTESLFMAKTLKEIPESIMGLRSLFYHPRSRNYRPLVTSTHGLFSWGYTEMRQSGVVIIDMGSVASLS